jgi:DNA repair protein RecO (recombination protein O)
MLHKTKGIVFNHIKYRDTSIITKIFTSEFGIQTYIVNGIRSSRSRQRMSSFQPLNQLDMVVYKNEKKEINRISEYKTLVPYHTIYTHPIKRTIILFLSEVLTKLFRDEHQDDPVFNFMSESLVIFDRLESGYQDFHLQFLMKLLEKLGHLPQEFSVMINKTDKIPASLMKNLFTYDYQRPMSISHDDRKTALERILNYYRMEFDALHNLKSLPVLKEVLY